MKVFRIGNGEVLLVEMALESMLNVMKSQLENKEEGVDLQDLEYSIAHTRTTLKLMQDQRLQELCERCLSYFWDRLSEEGIDNPDVEYLADEMGASEEELKMLFREAGFEEE